MADDFELLTDDSRQRLQAMTEHFKAGMYDLLVKRLPGDDQENISHQKEENERWKRSVSSGTDKGA